MAVTSITVSYSGVEKRVHLAVKPSIELSDDQVNIAQLDLHSKLRELFKVPSDDEFYLHEAETARVMSKESFREYTVAFPSHWYLVSSGDSIRDTANPQHNGLPATDSNDDLMATLHMHLPNEMTTPPSDDTSSEGRLYEDDGEDDEEEVVPQLEELTALPEQSYSSNTLTCDRHGSFGLTLRHFTIQSERPETPLEEYERPISRLSNESLELKLSTTFIYRLVKGGVAQEAGIEEGMVVHMLNGSRILGSSTEEIRAIVNKCAEQLTLLTLPKEHDDLQFLYPRYTYGPPGVYSTKDGQVTATDIKVLRGKDSKVTASQPQNKPTSNHIEESSHVTSVGVAPPSDMVVFNDTDFASQENSQSCDPHPPRRLSHDLLVEGSLEQILTHRHPVATHSPKGSARPPPGPSNEWYNDTEDFSLGQEITASDQIVLESSTSDSNFLSKPNPLPVRVRTRSNSSLEAKHHFIPSSQSASSPSDSVSSKTALTSSMSALDHLSRYPGNYQDRARSTDLGRFKIKRRGDKSLEGLTRIASDGLQQRLSIRPISTKRRQEPPSPDQPKHDPPSWSSGPAHQMSQSSRHSNESTGSLQKAPHKKQSSRGYQSQRKQLHSRSRSKVTLGSSVGESLESGMSNGRPSQQSQRSPSTSQEIEMTAVPVLSADLTPDPHTPPTMDEPLRQVTSEPHQPTVRKVPLNTEGRPRFNRPMSAVEPMRAPAGHHGNLKVPFSSEPSKKIPIFKTRSIGEQVFREVNIEEAIAASQADQGESFPASQGDTRRVNHWSGRSNSIDATVILDTGKKKGRKLFGRKQGSVDLVDGSPETSRGLGKTSALHRLSSEVLNTLGLSSSSPTHDRQTNIQYHGVLSKKQDLLDSGKRAGDRSWHSYYAVLASNRISFYRDRKEARLRTQCDEPPIDVVPSKTDYASNYTKKKFVFRVITEQGAVYLLQASDAPSLKNWVTTIQELNGGPPSPVGTLQRSKDSDSKLAPPSPSIGRRASSPHYTKGKKKEEGGKRLLDRFKARRKRNKDEPDFSSFVTFGQPLEECPVSLENKKVPLVVEYCVKTIEELGLDVEGIYRKPGQSGLIKNMSAEMDKGNYDFTQEDMGDVHTVGSLFKKFFKELPDPMIPETAHEKFIACARINDEGQRLATLGELVYELPMAHYHTLKYLMQHLKRIAGHSELNKMTFRNVALVFGPTLMRGAAEDLLTSMNDSYTIVETLCRHVDHLFSAELCGEEQRTLTEQESVECVRGVEDVEGVSRGSPALRHRDRAQGYKDTALATASPQSVRRVRNNLTGNDFHVRSAEPQRSSLVSIDGTLTPKQANWDPHTRGANRSVDSGVGSPGDHRSPEAVGQGKASRKPRPHIYEDVERPRVMRHAYEDVERVGGHQSESRTSSWVSAHSELGWGKREGTGSMWAAHNRRDPRKVPRRQESFERERDLTSTVHASGSYFQRAGTLPTSTTISSPRRKTSYVTAMGDAGRVSAEDRFTFSFTDTRTATRYSHSPSHRQSNRPGERGFDSLQRPATSGGLPRRPRRGSESLSEYAENEGMQSAKAMLLRPGPVKPSAVQRTRSQGTNRASGTQRLSRTGSGRQLEPPIAPLKQSLL